MHKALVREARTYLQHADKVGSLADECFRLITFSGQGATSSHFILEVNLPGGELRRFFVKRYGSGTENRAFWQEQLINDYNNSCFAAEGLSSSQYLKVAKPAFLVTDELLLVAPFVSGIVLSSFLHRELRFSKIKNHSEPDKVISLVGGVAKGLSDVCRIGMSNTNHTLKEASEQELLLCYRDSFNQMADTLRHLGVNGSFVDRCSSYFDGIIVNHIDKRFKMTFEHSDFIPQNLLLTDRDEVYLYDFPNSKFGTYYVDVAHFISCLDDYCYLKTVDKGMVSRLIRRFIADFREEVVLDDTLLSAFLLYCQFYSTSIILKSKKRIRDLFLKRNFYDVFYKNSDHYMNLEFY